LQYFRVRHHIHMFVSIFAKPFAQKTVKCMECDDLLTQLLADGGSADARLTTLRRTNSNNSVDTVVSAAAGTAINKQRARLAAQVSGGQKMTFKWHAVTPELIDAMEDAEIEELHDRYEARLGAAMSKSLGSSLLHMYASMVSMLLPLPPSRQLQLVADLEQDPFASSALQSACCELY